MMKSIRFSTIFLVLVGTIFLHARCSFAFSPLQQHNGALKKRVSLRSLSSQQHAATSSPSSFALFRNPNKQQHASNFVLRMTTEDSKDSSENNDTKSVDSVSDVDDDEDGADDKPSIVKTVLLTVPLFCKFVVVLVIKLLTDVVVFPLLFLYRLAGQAKRKVLKMFTKNKLNDGEPANGASE